MKLPRLHPTVHHQHITTLSLLVLLLSSCGENRSGGGTSAAPPSPPAAKAAPLEGSAPNRPEAAGAGGAGKLAALPRQAGPPPPVSLPSGKATGRLPAEWEGREAAEEERRLRESGQWETARPLFFEQWGKTDPVAAITASRSTDPGAITPATAAAVTGWASVDPQAARDWVLEQPANAEHAAFAGAVLESARAAAAAAGGKPDYALLADWLGGQTDVPSIQPSVQRFVQDWGKEDRTAALDWVRQQVGGAEARTRIQDAVIRDAVSADAEGFVTTGQWLQERPPGRARDELLLAFVKEAARLDPAASSKWAALIEDETLRKSAEKICRGAAQ